MANGVFDAAENGGNDENDDDDNDMEQLLCEGCGYTRVYMVGLGLCVRALNPFVMLGLLETTFIKQTRR